MIAPSFSKKPSGFTLVELLVTIAILGVLASLAANAFFRVQASARSAECMNQMRQLGVALTAYAHEHNGELPRSFHSAASHSQPGWAASIYPYLSGSSDSLTEAAYNQHFRCPEHEEESQWVYSYGLNVHFELDPDGDDYTGEPATWRRLIQIPSPSRTVLFGESNGADHFMAHQWASAHAAEAVLAHERHQKKSNYVFVDGHAEALKPGQTLSAADNTNLWNPSLAF